MRTRLVEQARDGDDVAFAELVGLDGDLCFAIAYRILRDTERAQDAVQQAFLLAWRELPRLRDPERFGPWLHRLLVNACYEELRRHRRWSTHIRVLPVDGPGGPAPGVGPPPGGPRRPRAGGPPPRQSRSTTGTPSTARSGTCHLNTVRS